MDWPFDQAPNTAAITTKQVIEDNLPILSVVHYPDDHSWAFTCGTSNESADARVIGMGEIIKFDTSVREIASLPPGWGAYRTSPSDVWQKYEMSDS